MPTSFNLAPNPLWVINDANGAPISNGYMYTYRDTVRSQIKAVYQDIAGTVAWIEPIIFNSGGEQGPFYWASDENYFIQIFDASGTLIKSVEHFNAPNNGGIVPITTYIDANNYWRDPQFQINYFNSLSPVPTFVGLNGRRAFNKNNTSAIDTLSFVRFAPGDLVPPSNPIHYLQYDCTGPGAAESLKDLVQGFTDVRTFQNSEITIAFWAQCLSVANTLELHTIQNFGIGGAPSLEVDTPITTFVISNVWTQYSFSFIVPSIAGKVIGTTYPGYLDISLRYPLNVTSLIRVTNLQINIGGILYPFFETSVEDSTLQVLPPLDFPITQREVTIQISKDGFLEWGASFPVGGMMDWPLGTVPNAMWHFADGASLLVGTYLELFQQYGYFFGGAGANFSLPDYRGYFLRTLDQGAGIDPGRLIYTIQGSALEQHQHDIQLYDTPGGAIRRIRGEDLIPPAGVTVSGNVVGAATATETRPINKSVTRIIKLL